MMSQNQNLRIRSRLTHHNFYNLYIILLVLKAVYRRRNSSFSVHKRTTVIFIHRYDRCIS